MTDHVGDFTGPGTPQQELPTPDPWDTTEEPDLTVGTDSSDLDALRAELVAEAPASDTDDPYAGDDFVTVPVTTRPGWAIVCRLDFTGRDLDRWRKAARDKKFEDKLDGIKFAALLLGATCVALLRNGKAVQDGGEPIDLPFQSRAIMALYSAPTIDLTVRAFFRREGVLDSVARRVTTEAGWGDEVYATDPTV